MRNFDTSKIIRTTRLSITCLILLLITWYYKIPESAWALITIWFVMFEYSTIGGVFQKSFYRFIGTFLSALYGILIVYFFNNDAIVNMIAFVVGVFIYSYFFMTGERSYVGTIGGVTLTIVLFNYNHIDIAIIRVCNIILGILISIIMMRCFFPVYARDEIIKKQKMILQFFLEILNRYLDPKLDIEDLKNFFTQHELEIRNQLTLFHIDIKETKWETRANPQFILEVDLTIKHIKRFFQILSIFISVFSTEKMHQDPSIRIKVKEFTNTLEDMLVDFSLERENKAEAHPALPTENTMIIGMQGELLQLKIALKNELKLYRQF